MSDTSDTVAHPAGAEAEHVRRVPVDPIMRFFRYGHLPVALQPISAPFYSLAEWMQRTIPRSAERTVALRKLLESKDAAVRAYLPEEPELAGDGGDHER